MSVYMNQLRRMVEALTIVSPKELLWFGRSVSAVSGHMPRERRMAPRMAYLRDSLQWHLYQAFYCPGGATPWVPGSAPTNETRNFEELLTRSNVASGSWTGGWKVWRASHHGNVGVAHNGLQCWASQSDVAADEPEPIAPGLAVRVRVPAERLRGFPGFYGILGGKDLDNREIVRFYWNLEHDAAPILVRELSASLNAAQLAYQLKVVSNPSGYCRCDAGVLYIHQADFGDAANSVRHGYSIVRQGLKPQVPALTRRLAPGLGFAENPDAATSFGFQRCGLIGEALAECYMQRITSVPGRLDVIAECFERQGISLDHPYLNDGSADYPDLDFVGDTVAE